MKLLICAASLALALPTAAAAEPSAACEAAAHVIATFASHADGRVVVVGMTPDRPPPKAEIAKRPPGSWRDHAPPPGLMRRWAAAPNGDVLQCDAVKAVLAERKLEAGEAAVDALVSPGGKRTSTWKGVILSVGMPTLSEDGRQAIVEIGTSCGGLCGMGSLLYLRRVRGAWLQAGGLGLWIS
jgi:hypothetical protein